MVLFFFFATLFYHGEYAAVNCLLMLFLLQNFVNSWGVNSPSLSIRKLFIYTFVSFSTWFLKLLKVSKACDFSTKNTPKSCSYNHQ